jgi:branched-chain amino acid aminotransferase
VQVVEKKSLDWANLDFSYRKTDKSYFSNFMSGRLGRWALTSDNTVSISECAGFLNNLISCLEQA